VTESRFPVRTSLALLGLVSLAAVFAYLGAWQLERADESRDIAARFAAGAEAAPLASPPSVVGEGERFRRLIVHGSYVAAPQFLLDNMLHDGTAGYQVLTPLKVDGASRWLLVNRGWVPVGLDRGILPQVEIGTAPRTVTGRIERLPRPGLALGGPTAAAAAAAAPVAVVEYPTAEELAEKAGEPLFDYELLLDPDEPDGYVRDWRAPGLGPERHWAYAGQWLLFSAGAAVAAVAMAFRAARRRT
jgi:surfeit locus 1 family protein